MNRRLGIPAWRDTVSTTCDFARDLLIVDIEGKREIARHNVVVPDEGPILRAARIRDLHVQEILCGAISQPLAAALEQAAIRVFPFVTGSVEEVLTAHLCGQLGEPRFLLPGCQPGCRRRWRRGQQQRAQTRKGWR